MVKKIYREWTFETEKEERSPGEYVFDITFRFWKRGRKIPLVLGFEFRGVYRGITIYNEIGDPAELKPIQLPISPEHPTLESMSVEEVLKFVNSRFEKGLDGHWRLKVEPERFKKVYISGRKKKQSLEEIGKILGMSGSSVGKYAKELKISDGKRNRKGKDK